MRRHLEQLQAVATSGVEGNFIRTAPQWYEPSCICVLREGRVLVMPSDNNYAAWVYGSLHRNGARFCSTERLQTQILCGGMVCVWPNWDGHEGSLFIPAAGALREGWRS